MHVCAQTPRELRPPDCGFDLSLYLAPTRIAEHSNQRYHLSRRTCVQCHAVMVLVTCRAGIATPRPLGSGRFPCSCPWVINTTVSLLCGNI